jgi:hypothetical protein
MKGELLEITAENIQAGDFLCPLPGPHRIRAHLDVITTPAQPRCPHTGAVLFRLPTAVYENRTMYCIPAARLASSSNR